MSKNFKLFSREMIIFFALFLFTSFSGQAQESLSIVPYPKSVNVLKGTLLLDKVFTLSYTDESLKPAAELLIKDIYTLFQFQPNIKADKGQVSLSYNKSLGAEEYTLQIMDKGIFISGGSYNAVCMGITSLLQIPSVENGKLKFVKVNIKDKPVSDYRGVLLDIARQWHNIETVKQVVELCRWYKIKYLQLHLSDDQSFTFPSNTYPLLASKDRHYTIEELKDLVEFAKTRGVVIIPEFDAPGHTTAIRKNMPELFGNPDIGVVNMNDERVYGAMDTIMKEMMDVFYTSPYFHIGGDEAWLGNYEKLKETNDYVKKMGFDNAHDVYLNFLVRMHNIVKKYNKKTLVWESFPGTGSRKVQIPKDMIVFAWETAYQRPESLLKNGYTIINASWKPTYITPGFRWEPDYIYNWNIRRWENHWNATPSYHHPIQLDKNTPIFGGQMCAWEMSEEQEIPSLHQRVPAISEVFWNGDNKKSYADFRKRYLVTDNKFNKLIFPVTIVKEGFTEPAYEGIYFNRENLFSNEASLSFKPVLPQTKITFTTDGSMPTVNSPELPDHFTIDKKYAAKLGVFNKNGDRIGYKIVSYELNTITAKVTGHTLPLRDTSTTRPRVEFIDNVKLSFDNLKKGSEIRFTTDGSRPTTTSQLYSEPIAINASERVNAVCYYNGIPYGNNYSSEFLKKDYEKNITTGKKIYPADGKKGSGENIEKAVDGFVDLDSYWDSHEQATSLVVDLGKTTSLSKLTLFTYWDGNRFYTYNVALSNDGKKWETVIDRSGNKEKASKDGYSDVFSAHKARYIKINMLSNSGNKSMHIVEIRAN